MRTIQKISPTTRIAVMTAYADEKTREIIRRETYQFLEKPLDLSKIREIVG